MVFLRSDQFLHTSTYVYFIYPRLIHLDILSYLNFLNEYANFSRHFRLDKVLVIAMTKHNHFTHMKVIYFFKTLLTRRFISLRAIKHPLFTPVVSMDF